MTNTTKVLVLAAALSLPAFSSAQAQMGRERMSFGLQVNFADDADIGVGARLRHSLAGVIPNAPLSGIASIDFYFPGDPINSYIELNYNVVYNFTINSPRIRPYAGGGLNFARLSVDTGAGDASDTEVGLNILGGILFRTAGRVTPFVELKIEAGGGEQFVITGGLHF